MTDAFQVLRDRLDGVKNQPDGSFMARCPAHEDRNASLHVTEVEDGRVLLNDFGGCEFDSIVKAAGVSPSDLMGESENDRRPVPTVKVRKPEEPLGPIVERYVYEDAGGTALYSKTRHDPKTFRLWLPDANGGWKFAKGDGPERVLFRLPRLVEAVRAGNVVAVVEGEKAVLALERLGIPATCAGGASVRWPESWAEHFKGAEVCILPDDDAAGRKHAEQAAAILHGTAKLVKVVLLPGLPPKGDPFDFVAAGGTLGELNEAWTAAPEWEPIPIAPEPEAPPVVVSESIVLAAEALAGERPEPKYLIEGILPEGGLGNCAGYGGIGKTTLLRQLAVELARGRPLLNGVFPERDPVPVVFLGVEGAYDQNLGRLRDTLRGLAVNADHHLPLYLPSEGYRPDVGGLSEIVEKTGARLVVLDTGRRFTPGMDENSAADVLLRFITPLDRVRQRTGAAVVFTQHLRKPARGEAADRFSIRGSTAFVDDVDLAFTVVAPENNSNRREIRFEKVRFGPDRKDDPLALLLDPETATFRAESETDRKSRENRRFDLRVDDVLGVLTPGEWFSIKAVHAIAGGRLGNVKEVIQRLLKDGLLEQRTVPSTAGRERAEFRLRNRS